MEPCTEHKIAAQLPLHGCFACLERELAEARASIARWPDDRKERDRLRAALDRISDAHAAAVDTGHPDATLVVVAQDEYRHLQAIAREALAGGEAE